jgi:hypothetical protein
MGKAPRTSPVGNAASAAEKFQLSRRRNNLSFAHNAEVAALRADEADLLDWREETIATEGWGLLRRTDPWSRGCLLRPRKAGGCLLRRGTLGVVVVDRIDFNPRCPEGDRLLIGLSPR